MIQRSIAAALAALDQQIAARSILRHPFYRSWTAGALHRQDLAVYARLYYPHVAAFPGYLEAAVNGADLEPVRAELAENLREERSEPRPHAELWLRFAAAVGAEPAMVCAATPAPGVQASVDEFRRLCAGSTAEALGALYAYESQQPEVSTLKAAGLRELYGVADTDALSYFSVHAEADVRHREGERRAIAQCLAAGGQAEELQDAAAGALDAYWLLLDAVSAETGGAEPARPGSDQLVTSSGGPGSDHLMTV